MALVVVADRYHHFVPSAPSLLYEVPKYDAEVGLRLIYQYKVTPSTRVYKDLDSKIVQYPVHEVYVNGVFRGSAGYFIDADYIKMINVPPDYPYAGWPLPPIGATVKVIGRLLDPPDLTADRFQHLDMKHVLIQGANPGLPEVFQEHNNFQGGFRLKHIQLSEPKFGRVRYCPYHLGFDYEPPLSFEGLDSFSYCLETEFGQRSDAGCISIQIGSVQIGEL